MNLGDLIRCSRSEEFFVSSGIDVRSLLAPEAKFKDRSPFVADIFKSFPNMKLGFGKGKILFDLGASAHALGAVLERHHEWKVRHELADSKAFLLNSVEDIFFESRKAVCGKAFYSNLAPGYGTLRKALARCEGEIKEKRGFVDALDAFAQKIGMETAKLDNKQEADKEFSLFSRIRQCLQRIWDKLIARRKDRK